MMAARTVEEKPQEADKVFTSHPWSTLAFLLFSLISVRSHEITSFPLCEPEFLKVIFECLKR